MNGAISLNLNWLFAPRFEQAFVSADAFPGFEAVHIPHTVKLLPLNGFSEQAAAFRSTYVKFFDLPQDRGDQRFILEFEGVMACFDLYVNGRPAGGHKGGYSRSWFDITDFAVGGRNKLVLMVDSTEREDIPPFGYTLDYITYGGIYRDVTLYIQQQTYLRHFLARYELQGQNAALAPELILQNAGAARRLKACVQVRRLPDGAPCCYTREIEVPAGEARVALEPYPLCGVERWRLERPTLYEIVIELRTPQGSLVDRHRERTGFRTVECRPEGFFINGEPCKLMGLNRHQAYPYAGYAMGARAQRKDADILRCELACNCVRTSHYMQSRHFLDRCDEVGLLVFEEIPGWGHIGGEAFKEVSFNDLRCMVTDDFNHPAIFLWGTRLNETLDDDEFYAQTQAIAKSIDPGRATGGVRYIERSHLLEDVYAYNDFTHLGGEKVLNGTRTVTGLTYDVPFLVSEFNGAVFATKSYDTGSRRQEHALRHARVQSLSRLRKNSLGAIGWCAFDYNTHGDYGSGDKVCYHGVMDMFRVPKYAAYLYASQKPPQEGVVLEPCTTMSRGDHDDNLPVPFTVLTNCDYIDVTLFGDQTERYFPSEKYAGLAHPPIEVDKNPGFWQTRWQGAVIVGYVGGREAARRVYPKDAWLQRIQVLQDDPELFCDRVDETRFVCRCLDQQANLLVYQQGVIQVQIQGPLEIIGPNALPLAGGTAAFWVRTVPAQPPAKAPAEARVRVTLAGRPEIPPVECKLRLCAGNEAGG